MRWLSRSVVRVVPAFAVLLLAGGPLGPSISHAASTHVYVVTRPDDVSSATACTTAPTDCSLRGAVADATAIPSGDTAMVLLPPGTYTLSLGELDLGTDGQTITVCGVQSSSSTSCDGSATGTIIQQDNLHIGFVLGFDAATFTSASNLAVSFTDVTIENGYADTSTFGGGAIEAGGGSGDTLAISNSIFSANTDVSGSGGGAINFVAPGTMSVANSTFSGNTTTRPASASTDLASGGAINFTGDSLTISGSTFSNNTAGSSVGSGAAGAGGAIYGGGGTATSITDSAFVGNTAYNGSGAPTGLGGALYYIGATPTIEYNRIVGNVAADGSGIYGIASSASPFSGSNANDNWWGSNSGAGTSVFTENRVTNSVASTPPAAWLQLRNAAASPGTVAPNGTITVTADLLGTAGATTTPLPASDLTGLPDFTTAGGIFTNPQLGTLSNASADFHNGAATVTFNAGSTTGNGSVDATADGVTVTAPITISNPSFALTVRFAAVRHQNLVRFHWTMASVTTVAGFNVYAGSTRLNTRLIPQHAASSYRYTVHYRGHARFTLHIVLIDGSEYTVRPGA